MGGHRRPVAALHQALAELEVDASLQLHCKHINRVVRTLCDLMTDCLLCGCFGVDPGELTRCVGDGGGGPGHGGQAVRRLALCALLLLFLGVGASFQAQGDGGLAVGAREAGEEDAADALPYARRSYSGKKRKNTSIQSEVWFKRRQCMYKCVYQFSTCPHGGTVDKAL